MLKINKGAAPRCLKGLKAETLRIEGDTGKASVASDWGPGGCSQPIRDALHRDQRGLCGYCMQRIGRNGQRDVPPPNGNRGMRIEHLTTRDDEPTKMYDWDNLLGVCGGRSGAPGGAVYDHCDRARGNKVLRLNPTGTTPHVESVLHFSRKTPDDWQGDPKEDAVWIYSDDYGDDIKTLNLNNPALRRRRRETQKGISMQLARLARRNGNIPRRLRELAHTAATPDSNGQLPEFAAVVREFVQRKLRAQ